MSHGTITLVMNKDGTVSATDDLYNFDRKKPYFSSQHVKRNFMNEVDIALSGPGTPFYVKFSGSVQLEPRKVY